LVLELTFLLNLLRTFLFYFMGAFRFSIINALVYFSTMKIHENYSSLHLTQRVWEHNFHAKSLINKTFSTIFLMSLVNDLKTPSNIARNSFIEHRLQYWWIWLSWNLQWKQVLVSFEFIHFVINLVLNCLKLFTCVV
jgi:hypothetical protein